MSGRRNHNLLMKTKALEGVFCPPSCVSRSSISWAAAARYICCSPIREERAERVGSGGNASVAGICLDLAGRQLWTKNLKKCILFCHGNTRHSGPAYCSKTYQTSTPIITFSVVMFICPPSLQRIPAHQMRAAAKNGWSERVVRDECGL